MVPKFTICSNTDQLISRKREIKVALKTFILMIKGFILTTVTAIDSPPFTAITQLINVIFSPSHNIWAERSLNKSTLGGPHLKQSIIEL